MIRQLHSLRCHLIFVLDHGNSFYLGDVSPSPTGKVELAASLREIIDDLRASKVYCLGLSIGGYAALRFGLELHAEAVVAMSALVNPTRLRGVAVQSDYLRRVRRKHPDMVIDAVDLYQRAERRPRVTLCYGNDHIVDRVDAETMRDIPGVRLMPIDGFSDHMIVRWFFANNTFLPTVQEAFFGSHPLCDARAM